MAGLWNIVVPEETTNLVTNPSVEIKDNTTGWAAMAGAIAQDTSNPPYGLHDLKCTPAVGVDDGCYFGTVSLTSGTSYTLSFYFKGVDTITYKAYFATTGAVLAGAEETFTGDGLWHRYTETWACDSTAAHRVYITKDNDASVGAYYVDALQVEAAAYVTTYVDGDQEPVSDYSWSGVKHASTSTRLVTSRAGGRIKNLRDDYYFYSLHPTGIGAPPVTNYYTDYALLAGALHEHTKIHGRLFILNGLLKGTSLSNLHTRRSALYNALRPDEDTQQPVLIQYTGGPQTLEIAAYYDGGLEWGMVTGFAERLGIRFYCPQPEWLGVVT